MQHKTLESVKERKRSTAGMGLLIGLAVLLLFGGLGRLPVFGRDEALYAEAAREMFASGDWITPRVNGVVFFEKPPLYYWMAAATYSALGVTPLAARLPAAMMGLATVIAVAVVTARVWGLREALLAGLALATSLQFVMIGRMGIMDVPLTCLITLAMMTYVRWRRSGGVFGPLAFGLLVGAAILLKGLAGGLAPAIAFVHALTFRRGSGRISLGSIALALGGCVLIAAPWFLAMSVQHGERYTSTFFLREHLARMAQPMQGHSGPILYYLAIILVSFFPWVMFLPAACTNREGLNDTQAFWRSLALVWILVVLVPFSLIRTKLPGYVTPLFPAMAMLVGVEIDRQLREPSRAIWIASIIGAVVLSSAFALLPVVGLRLGERIGAESDAWLLVVPTAFWLGGYAAIAFGGARSLAGRLREGLGFMVGGQLVLIGALIFGVLPVLSPYVGGAPATLAQRAARDLRGHKIMLYETRPETVAFALERTVPTFSYNEKSALKEALIESPSALIAPIAARNFRKALPAVRTWRHGGHILLDIPKLDSAALAHIQTDESQDMPD